VRVDGQQPALRVEVVELLRVTPLACLTIRVAVVVDRGSIVLAVEELVAAEEAVGCGVSEFVIERPTFSTTR
jgi:hypothetical protein